MVFCAHCLCDHSGRPCGYSAGPASGELSCTVLTTVIHFGPMTRRLKYT